MLPKNEFHFSSNEKGSPSDGYRPDRKFFSTPLQSLHNRMNNLVMTTDIVTSKTCDYSHSSNLHAIFEELLLEKVNLLENMENDVILANIHERGPYFALGTSSLDDALNAACHKAINFAGFYKVNISSPPRGLGRVVGDGFFLEKALLCLIRIAIIFSRPNGEVRIQAPSLQNEACLSIEAHGFSVPKVIMPHFFDAVNFQNKETPMDGLGLAPAVANGIITRLDGVLTLSSIHPVGTRFHIVLPRQRQG